MFIFNPFITFRLPRICIQMCMFTVDKYSVIDIHTYTVYHRIPTIHVFQVINCIYFELIR